MEGKHSDHQPDSQDLRKDSELLRSHFGLLDLSERDRVCLLGADRLRFLNGQVTNNIKDLSPFRGCYALVVSNKGIIEGDSQIYSLADELLVDLEPGQGEAFRQRLERYLVSDDVEIVDVRPHFGLITVQGPKSAEALAQLKGLDCRSVLNQPNTIAQVSHLEGGEIYLANHPRLGSEGFDFFVAASRHPSLLDELKQLAQSQGAKLCHPDSFDPVRIEAGIPRFPIDMEPSVLAPELGQTERMINYTKGCYIGQEVINRIKSIGRVNRCLAGLIVEENSGPLGTGAPIHQEDKVVGFVTSHAFSHHLNRNIGLAILRTSVSEPGTQLQARIEGYPQPTRLTVTDLPFPAAAPSEA